MNVNAGSKGHREAQENQAEFTDRGVKFLTSSDMKDASKLPKATLKLRSLLKYLTEKQINHFFLQKENSDSVLRHRVAPDMAASCSSREHTHLRTSGCLFWGWHSVGLKHAG